MRAGIRIGPCAGHGACRRGRLHDPGLHRPDETRFCRKSASSTPRPASWSRSYVFNKPLRLRRCADRRRMCSLIYWPESAPARKHLPRRGRCCSPRRRRRPRYIMRQTEAFEPVLASRVTEPGEVPGLTAKLATGMRAFAIKVDVASGVSGFVQPGRPGRRLLDRLGRRDRRRHDPADRKRDAASSRSTAGNEGSTSAAIIARTVTVAVTPEQVARLAQAQATGRLSLSLVGAGDDAWPPKRSRSTATSLLGIVEPEVRCARGRRSPKSVSAP